MSIHTIPEISIGGLGGTLGRPFFGGYIYDLNYTISVGNEGVSTVTASLVNETGNYSFSTNDLRLDFAYNIKIGSLNFNMFPKSFRKRYSPKGNLLELEFMDGSFILDKYFVGLHKKHGWNPKMGQPSIGYGNNPSCFIIVGREFHPCDINNDGIVNIKDIKDPCHPCQQEQNQINQARLVDCKNMSKYNIFEVKYNFTELINALSQRGFQFRNANDPNPQYFKDHTGSIRDVLSAWCHNFGWIFFWDNGIITFKDLRTVPVVNATIQNFCPYIENYEEEYTLEGTFDKMVLTNFSRAGQDKDYDCYDAVWLQIPNLNQTQAPAPSLDVTSDIDYDAAGLAYYSKELRDLYLLTSHYGLKSRDDYSVGTELEKLGLVLLSNPLRVNLSHQAYFQGVIEPSSTLDKPPDDQARETINDPEPDSSRAFLDDNTHISDDRLRAIRDAIKNDNQNVAFKACFELLDNEAQWKVAANIDHYFFFIGHYDSKVDDANYEAERNFAESFIGKYYIYVPNLSDPQEASFFQDFTFYDDPTCGTALKNDNRVNYEFLGDTGGNNLRYYNGLDESDGSKKTMGSLPFAKFLAASSDNGNGSRGSIPFKMIVLEKEGEGFFPSNTPAKADTSSIFQNGGNNWLIQDQGLTNQAHSFYPKALPGFTSDKGENVARLISASFGFNVKNIDNNKVLIFMGYDSFNRDAFQYHRTFAYNPLYKYPTNFNGDPLNLDIDPITQLPKEDIVYRYPELKCNLLGDVGYGKCDFGNFTTPVGSFQFYFPTYSSQACVLQKTRKVLKRINKYESVKSTGKCNSGNIMALQVDALNITDQDITKFFKVADNSCIYNQDAIDRLHQQYALNLGTSQTSPLIKRIFTVAGIVDTTLDINDGLQNISISADEQGVKSTYTFGTTHMLLPDPDVYSQIRDNINILDYAHANDVDAAPQLKPKGTH